MFTLLGIKDVQNTQKDAEFLSLSDYTKEAKKVISSYTKKVAPTLTSIALADDDFISNVVYEMAKADWKWKPGSKLNRQAFRQKYGKYCILDYLARCNIKTSHKALSKLLEVSLDYSPDSLEGDNHTISDLIECPKSNNQDENLIKEDYLRIIDRLCKKAKLTDKQEKCLKMFYLEEKNLSEIAKELKQTAPGIKQCITRALVKLQQVCGKSWE